MRRTRGGNMKIKQIRAVVSRTVNMGNYESLRIEAEQVAELDPGEDPKKAFQKLFERTKKEVKERTTSEEVKEWRKA